MGTQEQTQPRAVAVAHAHCSPPGARVPFLVRRLREHMTNEPSKKMSLAAKARDRNETPRGKERKSERAYLIGEAQESGGLFGL